ncbi:hypothetical protein [Nostoc sp. CALU 546]|uniref:hypothetical protein n=1 Tax=Nostoc sp. CALU 546 TaxID=1867241 RepID=UPI003B685224
MTKPYSDVYPTSFPATPLRQSQLVHHRGLILAAARLHLLRYPKRHKFTYPSLLNQQVYLSLANLGDGGNEDEEIIRRILSDPKGWCMNARINVMNMSQRSKHRTAGEVVAIEKTLCGSHDTRLSII